jgi:hypothetical protein
LPSNHIDTGKKHQVDEWKKIENLEIDPCVYKNLIKEKITAQVS